MGMEVIFPWQGMNEHPLNRYNCGGWGGLIWLVQELAIVLCTFCEENDSFPEKKKNLLLANKSKSIRDHSD